MNSITLVLISIGLAMDAFAVSLTEGLAMKKIQVNHILKVALCFGLFQAIMPILGWTLGSFFYDYLSKYDHLISFILLVGVGGKMIYDGWQEEKCEVQGKCEIASNILLLGFATSIDALAVGFSFSLVEGINIVHSVGIIGIITFLISSIGVYLGHRVGHIISYKTEYLGGAILILMGFKSLVEMFI